MVHARDNGDIVVLFPEARYSLCGTTAVLPEALGKMVQRMNVPLVTLVMHGHHINSPYWNTGNRKVKPIESEMTMLISQEETQTLSVGEINSRIAEAFKYDDYAWQKERQIAVTCADRAVGLEKVLYQCPACNTEYRMTSSGSVLQCQNCGKAWEMSPYGELSATSGETEYSHIPDWYEWERENVRRQVQDGVYSLNVNVRIESLPNSKRFVVFPDEGLLTHNSDGFTLNGVYGGEPFRVHWPVPTLHSCHIEYDYMGRGDCVDLNTTNDTFYLFPKGPDFAITKIALATEELFINRAPSL